MTLEQFEKDVEALRSGALAAFNSAQTTEELEAARIQFLGDRSGLLKTVQQALGALPKEDKPVAGRIFNQVKEVVTQAHADAASSLARRVKPAADLDLTMPA